MSEWTQDELTEFVERVTAGDLTFRQYAQEEYVRVGDALALHCFMDPAVLALKKKGRLSELKQLRSKLPYFSRLETFLSFVSVVLTDIDTGKLNCIKDKSDPLQSFVQLKQFLSYAIDSRLSVYPPQALSPKRALVGLEILPLTVRHLVEACELWKPVDQGGTVVPGSKSTEPDLESHFNRLGHKPSKSKTMASYCRPSTAHFGRPSKEFGR